ncbi:putative aldehyde dehydrogenase [Bacillus sp. TS-2]|nr:putative aldehyde dehydrogenase [Bacillus sp. TS-2]
MKFYINGEWCGEELEQIDVYNPATSEVIDTVPAGGELEAKRCVDAAFKALTKWRNLSAHERSDVLMKWFHLIEENEYELGKTMTLEQGKPLKEARGEINYANSFIKWYAEEGKRVYGETIPASVSNKRIFVQKQPIGVVAAITPWNFPAAMITRKVAPALAVGCTVIVKPAEQTPLTALKLIELAEKAGIPKGVINVITGDAEEITAVWQKDARVRKLTFTGSTEVGKILMKGAAETVKKLSLELGGHAPFIVMDDADLDLACEQFILSKFRNAGQTCICANRIYVHETVFNDFVEKAKLAVSKLKVGNGLEEEVDIGPLIDLESVQKVQSQLNDALEKGAELICGGKEMEGLYFQPTVLAHVNEEMICMQEETFGPVAPISSFKTDKEVIERANDSIYGLAAYVFTKDINRAITVSEQLDFGIIGINDGAPSIAQAPFGGMKQSGLGREGGQQGMEEFLEVKYMSLAISKE